MSLQPVAWPWPVKHCAHVVVYGVGAIGGVIGARLQQCGHRITCIARGAQLDALRDDGRVARGAGSIEVDYLNGEVVRIAHANGTSARSTRRCDACARS